MNNLYQLIARPPYRGLPWLLVAYIVFSVLYLHDGGVFIGDMFGYDDRVRMVQVLNWVNGAGFYDRTIMRVDPPEGFTTIWARIVDMPIALIIVIAQCFVTQKTAMLIALTVVPLAESTLMLVFAGPYFARPLLGRDKARLISLFLLFTSLFNSKYFSMSGFFVGEASHHPWYIILTVTMFGAAVRLAMGSARPAAIAMLALSVSLLTAVGIEGYPLIAVAAALPALVAWEGGRVTVARHTGDAFICAALASLILVPLHQPPQKLFIPSFVEPSVLGPILVAVAALFLKAEQFILQRLSGRKTASALTLLAIAGLFGGMLIWLFPQVLDGGAAGLSPNERWLALHDHDEAMSVFTRSHGLFDFLGLIMPTVLALAAGVYAVRQTRRRRRAVALCYLGFAACGGVLSEIYARYYHHAMTTACVWLAWLWEHAKNLLVANRSYTLKVTAIFIALGPFWMVLLPATLENAPFTSHVLLFPAQLQADYFACASLPMSDYLNRHYGKDTLLLAPYAYSPQFLIQTDMIVDFVGNYPSHDKFIDNYGFFKTRSAEGARDIVARHNADLVITCRAPLLYEPDLPMSDQEFIVRLQMGYVPRWLKPVAIDVAANFVLYEVDKKYVGIPDPNER